VSNEQVAKGLNSGIIGGGERLRACKHCRFIVLHSIRSQQINKVTGIHDKATAKETPISIYIYI
jgi:hypothetical protein